MTEPLTRQIAEWVVATATLPGEVAHQVRRSLVDYLSGAVLGATAEPAVIVREYLAETDRSGVSTVIATDTRLSPANAATANGTAAHAFDIDDGYTPGGGHPGASIISAALAVAEANGSSAPDLERAIALGYEVACRLGAATHPAQRNRGFHNTALFGVFGSTTAAAVLLGLDVDTLANAYGLAGAHAGGLLSFLDEGSHVKRYHPGKAARDGVISAELAQRGLTGPTVVLESEHGYFHAFAGDQHDVDHLMGGLGSTWRMLDTYNKPYPCCRHVHSAIDAVLDMRDEIDIDAVESITVDTFAIAATHDSKEIGDLLDAQMSLPYSVGAALVHGALSMESFDEPARQDPELRRIIETFDVRADDAYTSHYPRSRGARVTISAGGTEYSREVMQPYGEPDNPMSDDALSEKFLSLVTSLLGRERSEALLAAAWALDDTAALVALL